jgi:hypothetical protein
MAFTLRGRRTAFDNIAVGSATGRERTISGGGGETVTQYGGKEENYRTVSDSSYTSEKTIEHFIAGTTDQSNG